LFRPGDYMKLFVISLTMACALTFANAGMEREFRTSDGFARIRWVPQAAPSSDSADNAFENLAQDSTPDLSVLIAAGDGGEALLDIYFLDLATGGELRFPVKVSNLREYCNRTGTAIEGSLPDEAVIAIVRGLSKELSVRMKSPGAGSAK
jgi:hypothetical protein